MILSLPLQEEYLFISVLFHSLRVFGFLRAGTAFSVSGVESLSKLPSLVGFLMADVTTVNEIYFPVSTSKCLCRRPGRTPASLQWGKGLG